MDGSKSTATPTPRNSFGIPLILIVLAAAAYLALRTPHPDAREFIGIARPPLKVAGWLNTAVAPTDDMLRGKIVLVDNWASWCAPCREEMPHVAEFRRRFHDQGVVVIGLTPEQGEELEAVKQYVQSVPGLDWPIGYGAKLPMELMGITALPTMILFDASGRSVWAGHDTTGLDAATIAALAQK